MAPGVCPETEKLQRLQDGSLPAEQYAAMEAHVQQCPICLGRLKELLAMTDTLADQANAPRMQALMQSFLTAGGASSWRKSNSPELGSDVR